MFRSLAIIVAILAAIFGLASTATAATQHRQPDSVFYWGSYAGVAPSNEFISDTPLPVTIPDSARLVQVASSNSDDYALLADGTVWAWGAGGDGELGDGQHSFASTPVQVRFPAGVSIAYLPTDVMPYNTGLAVDTNGNAWGWGLNKNGELCMGNESRYDTPVKLPFADVTSLAGAGAHASYDSGGTVYACGDERSGELGNGVNAETDQTTPVPVWVLGSDNVVALTASYANSGAVLADGSYYDWGYNGDGNLGNAPGAADSAIPAKVYLPEKVDQVALGGDLYGNGQTLAVLTDGSLWAWGSDAYGQLGDRRTQNEPTPIQIPMPADFVASVVALATSGTTSYALSADGGVWAWGNGRYGQLGNGTWLPGQNGARPVRVDWGASLISATAHNVVIGG